MKWRVLVVPAGTEIAHEVYESLCYSKHWQLVGANTVRDHSEVTFDEMHYGLPHVDAAGFAGAVCDLVAAAKIDLVVPTHDEALSKLAGVLDADKLVGPRADLAAILRSKSRLLKILADTMPVPAKIDDPHNDDFPVFCKPDRGQGSRGARVIKDREAYDAARRSGEELLFQELLPGAEITVDCFSGPDHEVLVAEARRRERVSAGIATRMQVVEDARVRDHAVAISRELGLSGAWFFQMKEDRHGAFRLLEVANRIAGSSGFQRARGINLMDAWLHQKIGRDVAFLPPVAGPLVYDRALYARTRWDAPIARVYVDFDDTLMLDGGSRAHHRLIGVLFGLKIDKGVEIVLLTRHAADIDASLRRCGLGGLFDRVVHIQDDAPKSAYISPEQALFIDDSFRERNDVAERHGIPCLAPECVELLEGLLQTRPSGELGDVFARVKD